uniref:Uncharacterized protein n=1 Tax=Romanomermis culicivorax TaxID=13658 RepID=A0A915IIP2_ROMCU
MPLAADYAPPLVQAITIASHQEVKPSQAVDPTISKIVTSLQMSNAAKHPQVFFTEDGPLYGQIKDIKELILAMMLMRQQLQAMCNPFRYTLSA